MSDGPTYVSLIQGSGNSSLIVDGSGTTFTDNQAIFVGTNDVGNMTISNNAQVTSKDFFVVGLNATGAGTVTISSGGVLTSDSLEGAGNLSGDVAANPGSVGNVTVTGSGSEWINKQSLAIGVNGTGSLDIEQGGAVVVNGLQLRIGRNAGSYGNVTVNGSGSSISEPNGTLYVGSGGTGDLNISAGGNVTVQAIEVGLLEGSAGGMNAFPKLGLDLGDHLARRKYRRRRRRRHGHANHRAGREGRSQRRQPDNRRAGRLQRWDGDREFERWRF